jgi:hypothetical protein
MWVKFWKKSGPNGSLDETYEYYSNDLPKEDRDNETFESDSEDWAETVGGGFNTHYEWGWKKVQYPPIKWLQEKKEYIVEEINTLHRKHGVYQTTLNAICKKKGHIVKKRITEKGYETGGCFCSVCGENLGWYCPKNPKQYCEYDGKTEECIYCGEPEERK